MLLWPERRQPNLRRCDEETSQVMERGEASRLAYLLRYSKNLLEFLFFWGGLVTVK